MSVVDDASRHGAGPEAVVGQWVLSAGAGRPVLTYRPGVPLFVAAQADSVSRQLFAEKARPPSTPTMPKVPVTGSADPQFG